MNRECSVGCHQAFVTDKNVEACSPLCLDIGRYTASLTTGTSDLVDITGATFLTFFTWADKSVKATFY